MRDRLLTIVVGLAAGVGGALLVGARGSEPPAPAAVQVRTPPAAPIVPPGWDRRTVVHVTDVEAKADTPAAPEGPSEREAERLAHYQRELETRQTQLSDHAREPVDPAWASTSSDQLRAAAEQLGVTPRDIDCRSKTCVATLAFDSPSTALGFLHGKDMSSLITGFASMTSTPTPPTSDGDYDLTVVLARR